MKISDTLAGILLMVAASFVFSLQDGISRHLAGDYNIMMIVMLRYWFFAAFVVAIAARSTGGLRRAARTKKPFVQIFRGVLLAVEIWVILIAFIELGLIATHVIFASYPLIIAALSGPFLGERVGPWRWGAIAVGFVGIVVILRPGLTVFSPVALIALISATMFAGYGLLTRYVGKHDPAMTSFFWTGMAGLVTTTLGGVWFWEPMTAPDWGWMALLCMTGAGGHYLLIRCYELAEASAVQPFAYFQLVFVVLLGLTFFGETLDPVTAIGAIIVVSAGIFAAWRENLSKRRPPLRTPGT